MLGLGPLLELASVFSLQKIVLHHRVLVVSMISRVDAAVFRHLFHLDPVILKFNVVFIVFCQQVRLSFRLGHYCSDKIY